MKTARVNIDYHMEFDKHGCSVPYALTQEPVEIFHHGKPQVVEHILAGNRHPEQGYGSCLGIQRTGETYPHVRLEATARHALALTSAPTKS